ncbi:DMT family transporter [Falsirhodobacter sp. 20TX0035]|uniref:DMT family transporter n=1 Tax=Falsirhodobacter sp. 20TX0035 TaxID=3022019 RepID=UPI00232E7751|nr:EamA family transporter [Falsirhodobacter sp. 20TX0035]MDB6453098.1 EamA family transporter [Falsirhodobacter sp. 20TX0035]
MRMPAQQATTLTVVMMIGVAFLNALDAVIVRLLAGEVHAFVIGFFRALFGLLVLLPWIWGRVDLRASPYRWLHGVRAALKLASLIALFVAYQRASLPDATAIFFMLPLFVMLGAWLFLDERIGGPQIVALILALAGMVIVVRPGGAGFDPALLFALAAAALTASIQLMLKRMATRDTSDRLVAWNLLAMTGLGLVLALTVWTTPTPWQLVLLCAQGALGALNQTLVTRALKLSDASFVGPLDFLRLPAVALLAWALFGEVAGAATWIGAGLICLSVILATGAVRRRGA